MVHLPGCGHFRPAIPSVMSILTYIYYVIAHTYIFAHILCDMFKDNQFGVEFGHFRFKVKQCDSLQHEMRQSTPTHFTVGLCYIMSSTAYCHLFSP